MKYLLILAVTVVTATCHDLAGAQQQPWLADRRFGEGMGIRTGDLELHPGVAGEFGYDSNYFQRAPSEDVASALRLRIAPHLTLSTLGAQRRGGGGVGAPPAVNFRAGLSASYNEFFATDSRFSDDLSRQRNLEGAADAKLDILPERPWGGDLKAGFTRIADPSNDAVLSSAFNRSTITAGGGIKWRPGGGVLDWRVGYEFRHHHFERAAYRDLNNSQHKLETGGRWKFFPRTAMLYDANYVFTSYSTSATAQNDGSALRTRAGVNGLITNHFSVLAMAGWAQSYYDSTAVPARNYDGLVAHGEFKWFILPQASVDPTAATIGLSSISVGYTREFQNSYLGDFTQRDRGYLGVEYFAAGTVLLSLQGGLSSIGYPDSFDGSGNLLNPSFSEKRVDAALFAEYRLAESFALNGTLRYDANLTGSVVRLSAADPAAVDNLEFTRVQAWVGLRWFL